MPYTDLKHYIPRFVDYYSGFHNKSKLNLISVTVSISSPSGFKFNIQALKKKMETRPQLILIETVTTLQCFHSKQNKNQIEHSSSAKLTEKKAINNYFGTVKPTMNSLISSVVLSKAVLPSTSLTSYLAPALASRFHVLRARASFRRYRGRPFFDFWFVAF
jgi:hypothetical protein